MPAWSSLSAPGEPAGPGRSWPALAGLNRAAGNGPAMGQQRASNGKEDMAQIRSVADINERIRTGKAVVLNASEMAKAVKELGKAKAAREVDVVTTGTFSPMCSSGMLFNIGQKNPPLIKVQKMWLNDVEAYAGLAAVDAYLGATQMPDDDPLNKVYPGAFSYGGGHVIEDLVSGKSVRMRCLAYPTDCYPRKELEKDVRLQDLPNAWILNPRNCYQNYNAAVNKGARTIYTYMGPLKPNMRNANYATAGELSPLFNDPYLRTIGLGTKIFLGGGVGWVLGSGTQHNPAPKRTERGLPETPSGTLMLKGEMRGMNPRYVRGVSMVGYGCTLSIGVGIPIPVLDEDMAWFTGVSDEDIMMPVRDYSHDYPQGAPGRLALVRFSDLLAGTIEVEGQKVRTAPLTSRAMSLEIAEELKRWITSDGFELTEAQEKIESR